MDESKEHVYQRELFERLRKSTSLKREEECFGAVFKPAHWWFVETPAPKAGDIKKAIASHCTCLKRGRSRAASRCLKDLAGHLKRAAETKKLVSFSTCRDGMHGFIYPVLQGEKLIGFIGLCYGTREATPQTRRLFAGFTETLIREIENELELAKLYETVRPRAIALSTVHTVHRLISSTLNLHELLPRIARLSLQIMRANRCSIKLVDAKKKTLLPKATIDLREKEARLKKVKVGKYAPGKAVKYGRPIRSDDFIATPLIDEDIIGVITLYDKIDKKPFSPFDQEIMSTLAEQAVIAIRNAQLYKEQERLTMGSIKSLAALLESRGPGTYVPKASFVKIAAAIGQEMHLDNESLKSIQYAAILHDAGEIFVPDTVLSKPTKLTEKELEMVKEHPAAGVGIIKHIKALKTVTPFILYHHENYDGTGYPKGLKRDQIPLGARIMAVVSAFEAMIARRPYRTTRTVEEAIAEIHAHSGTQFDPAVVKVFDKVIRRKDITAALAKELHAKPTGERPHREHPST